MLVLDSAGWTWDLGELLIQGSWRMDEGPWWLDDGIEWRQQGQQGPQLGGVRCTYWNGSLPRMDDDGLMARHALIRHNHNNQQQPSQSASN